MSSRSWIGILLLVLGIGFLMQQAGIISFTAVLSMWWPFLFIFIGIVQFSSRRHSSPVSGLLFIIVGGLFLINRWVEIDLAAYILPIILISLGVVFIFSRSYHKRNVDSSKDLNISTFFSGAQVRNQSIEFQGGNITSVFGGAEIDLRDAVFSEEGATIDITSIFGGVEMKVPEYVRVEITGIPIFGGWEDKTRRKDIDSPLLKINALVIFGGVEVKD